MTKTGRGEEIKVTDAVLKFLSLAKDINILQELLIKVLREENSSE
jgi:hypothetical protein